MQLRTLRCVYTVIALTLLALFTACGGGSSTPVNHTPPPAATLQGVTLTGSASTITVGGTAQLTATGSYSDGSSKDVTSQVTWTSSNTAVATVSASGVVTAVGPGTATITGTINGQTASFTITVNAALTGVTINGQGLVAGTSAQFTATATYSDGSTVDVTSQVTWSSSDTTIATVSNSGMVNAVAAGTVQITGTYNGTVYSYTLTIQPSLVSIAVTPADSSIELNTTQQLTANGTYSDGSQQDLTAQVTWSSSDPTIATVDNTGLSTAVAAGTTTVTATLNSVSGNTTLTVNPPHLSSIIVDQDGMTVALGLQQQLSATGVFSDSSTKPLTGVTFTSSDSTIVSIDSNGMATTLATGQVTITATVGSVSGTGTFTVGAKQLVSVATSPSSASVALGLKQQFTVTGTFTDGSTQQLTDGVTWTVGDSSVASVDSTGLATSLAMGDTQVTATVGTLSSAADFSVTAVALQTIAVSPSTASVPAGATQQFTATGTYSDGSTQDLSLTATWISSDGTLATIDNTGLLTGVAAGSVTVTATSGTVSGTATVTVTNATVTSLTISPLNVTALKGTNVQFTATATYSDGSTRTVTKQATWSSSIPATVSINNNALATAHKLGTVTITATLSGQTATTTMVVVNSLP